MKATIFLLACVALYAAAQVNCGTGAGCDRCNDNGIGCAVCSAGYSGPHDEGGGYCTACQPTGCSECNTGACTSCFPGYRYSEGQCQACFHANCTACPQVYDVCTACADGFTLTNNNCVMNTAGSTTTSGGQATGSQTGQTTGSGDATGTTTTASSGVATTAPSTSGIPTAGTTVPATTVTSAQTSNPTTGDNHGSGSGSGAATTIQLTGTNGQFATGAASGGAVTGTGNAGSTGGVVIPVIVNPGSAGGVIVIVVNASGDGVVTVNGAFNFTASVSFGGGNTPAGAQFKMTGMPTLISTINGELTLTGQVTLTCDTGLDVHDDANINGALVVAGVFTAGNLVIGEDGSIELHASASVASASINGAATLHIGDGTTTFDSKGGVTVGGVATLDIVFKVAPTSMQVFMTFDASTITANIIAAASVSVDGTATGAARRLLADSDYDVTCGATSCSAGPKAKPNSAAYAAPVAAATLAAAAALLI